MLLDFRQIVAHLLVPRVVVILLIQFPPARLCTVSVVQDLRFIIYSGNA